MCKNAAISHFFFIPKKKQKKIRQYIVWIAFALLELRNMLTRAAKAPFGERKDPLQFESSATSK